MAMMYIYQRPISLPIYLATSSRGLPPSPPPSPPPLLPPSPPPPLPLLPHHLYLRLYLRLYLWLWLWFWIVPPFLPFLLFSLPHFIFASYVFSYISFYLFIC
ncbi:hypothetical protein V2W45_645366 [Cenococcum geophilum]